MKRDGNVHDGLIAGAAFRKLGDRACGARSPSASHHGLSWYRVPCRLQRGDGPGRIHSAAATEGERGTTSGLSSPKVLEYHFACFRSASRISVFRGIVLPSPAAVLLFYR